MACNECESGLFGCNCCCASVTNIKGGLHPDSIQSFSRDILIDDAADPPSQTHRSELLINGPVHIIGFNASLICVRRDTVVTNQDKQIKEATSGDDAIGEAATTASVSLYTLPGYSLGTLDKGGFNPSDNQEQVRRFFCTASLSSHFPTYDSPDDLFGFFADGGTFLEFNAPNTNYGVRVIVRYVPRLQFSPAYHLGRDAALLEV